MIIVGLVACLPADTVNTTAQVDTADAGIALDNNSQAAMDNVDTSILRIAKDVCSHTSQPFILVGGASLMLHGSTRITTDLDLLVPHDGFDEFKAAKDIILGQPNEEPVAYEHRKQAIKGKSRLVKTSSTLPYTTSELQDFAEEYIAVSGTRPCLRMAIHCRRFPLTTP